MTENETLKALLKTVSKPARAWAFYENEIYKSEYVYQYGLFDEIKEIFNPVPKIVFIMNALTMQKQLDIEIIDKKDNDSDNDSEDAQKQLIEKIWEDNSFQNMKYLLAVWLILNKKAIIELNKKTLSKGTEPSIIITLHDPDDVKIEKQGNKIIYAKIKGKAKIFKKDKDGMGGHFEDVSVTKEFYNIEGFKRRKETYDGEPNKDTSGPLGFDYIPIIEFETDYNLEPLFNKIDQYNQIEAYLDNIFYLHGDPLIWDTKEGVQMDETTKENIQKSRFKHQVMLHMGSDAKMQYLEMQGNIAQLMLQKQEGLLELIENDYPEYVFAKMLSKGDPSGDAAEIKATEIVTKVESLRGDINDGITKMNNMALKMLGKSEIDHKLKFGDILPKSVKELVSMIMELRSTKLITRETALKKFPEIIPDPEQELKNLEEEEKKALEDIHRGLSDHDHTED
ncbi:MAG: phage portal protein [Halanaerobiales bacterium]|nr:phage portal protein [Halanaerobiales bacterium]